MKCICGFADERFTEYKIGNITLYACPQCGTVKIMPADSNTGSFEKEVEAAVKAYEKACGHLTPRTWDKLNNLGYVKALSQYVVSGEIQIGFKKLCETGQKDKTFEAIILRYRDKFDNQIIECAQFRLNNAGKL